MDLENVKKFIDSLNSADAQKEECKGYKIIILQRGWVVVGRLFVKGKTCRVENARIIRRWGTTRGLGEVALNGPTDRTILDKASDIEYHVLSAVATLSTKEELWI